MPVPDTDTIAAIATPPGSGGIGIVRLSGPRARTIAEILCQRSFLPRRATLTVFTDPYNHEPIDEGIVLFFPAPHSFTGEDMIELQGHGSPVVLDMLLETLLTLGARLARPGEFSERAFLNDRLDLVQAEAIADLIESGSRAAARGALRSLEGQFSREIHTLVDKLTHWRMHTEACIDFPEEEIDFLEDTALLNGLSEVRTGLQQLLSQTESGTRLREGLRVVLAGAPNAGKSSLLNTLAERDSAIVTKVPGTTRDLLREAIHIDGIPLHLIDTAGLRNTRDPVEQEGVRRAREAVAQADSILWVIDTTTHDAASLPENNPELAWLGDDSRLTRVWNKIDLCHDTAGRHGPRDFRVSAKTGAGLEALKHHLKSLAGLASGETALFTARQRHLDALRRALTGLDHGLAQFQEHRAGELLAEDLRLCQNALGEITGQVTADDLLGKIFSSFCIGK